MACGTPALVMNSTAWPEVVCESNAGSVVECSTTDEEMVELLSETMSKNAPRECVLNNFTLQKQTKAYMALFNNEENI
jgi:glycosyltransferase involved in cell wall biosynthesis